MKIKQICMLVLLWLGVDRKSTRLFFTLLFIQRGYIKLKLERL